MADSTSSISCNIADVGNFNCGFQAGCLNEYCRPVTVIGTEIHLNIRTACPPRYRTVDLRRPVSSRRPSMFLLSCHFPHGIGRSQAVHLTWKLGRDGWPKITAPQLADCAHQPSVRTRCFRFAVWQRRGFRSCYLLGQVLKTAYRC